MKIDKSMEEVRAWKDAAHEELSKLPLHEHIRRVNEAANKLLTKYSICLPTKTSKKLSFSVKEPRQKLC